MKRYFMIACEIIRDEIEAYLAEHPVAYPIVYLPPDLHLFPDKLREYLQEFIDRIDNVDHIVLPMGRCGNGTLGLKSKNASLILPKCEDCVNLILSEDSLKVERPKYSMFFTEGWLRHDTSPIGEYRRTVEKYGKEKADMVMNIMYDGYKYFTLMDTGAYDKSAALEKLRPLAGVA
ncbi:MAG: DUF1638 domain-containing protein, partial [Bacillota bacterium]|nr:DUF1638 domain-containing protein [Bacillota bacterium]